MGINLRSASAGVWLVRTPMGVEARVHYGDSQLNARLLAHVAVAEGADVARAAELLDEAVRAHGDATHERKAAEREHAKVVSAHEGAAKALADCLAREGASDEEKAAAGAALTAAKVALDAADSAVDAALTAHVASTTAMSECDSRLKAAKKQAAVARAAKPVRIAMPAELERVEAMPDVAFRLCGPGGTVSVCQPAEWFEFAREVIRED